MGKAKIINEVLGGWREVLCCSDCGRWVDADSDDEIRHDKLCDWVDQAKSRSSRTQDLRRAAKEGNLRSIATDDEIVEAVRCGLISESDAMNQDF